MQYTINQLYDMLYKKTWEVYDVFKEFFGEPNVDLKLGPMPSFKNVLKHYLEQAGIKDINYEKEDFDKPYELSDEIISNIIENYSHLKSTIYVWWANVTITNEFDKSIDIQDLYAKVEVQMDGRIPYENIGFLLNRATYTTEQFLSDFLHSHVQRIPKYDFSQFMNPCLGRGPINKTIGTLKNKYDEVTWMLFCQELSMYVTVESITGVPWNRLEEVGANKRELTFTGYELSDGRLSLTRNISYEDFKNFIKYYIHNGHLVLSYRNGQFIYGMPYNDYIIDVSNSFIEYYNKYLSNDQEKLDSLYFNHVLEKVIMSNGNFYYDSSHTSVTNLDAYQGKFVLNFKGKDIHTTIINDKRSKVQLVTLLSQKLAMYVLRAILTTINYRYRNEHNESGGSEAASTYKRVIYI